MTTLTCQETAFPRARVVVEAWRDIGSGVEALSGSDGGPLTRTVKLILLPLVIRPTLRPELARDVLSAAPAEQLRTVIAEAAVTLRATAGWFTEMKRARRRLRVVGGNPQDRYFPACYELASLHGEPTAETLILAEQRVKELAAVDDGRTVDALRTYLSDSSHRIRLRRSVEKHWRARDLSPNPPAPSVAAATRVLNSCAHARTRGAATQELTDMVGRTYGTAYGAAIWTGADGWAPAGVPTSLKLTDGPVPTRPALGARSSTADLPAPLDRTIHDRLFIVLRGAKRESLQPVPALAEAEAHRSCQPLGLADETLRVAMLIGAQLAAGIDPLRVRSVPAGTAAHHTLDNRFRREATVLRARRITTGSDSDGGALAALASELGDAWVAYARRLWVRLHGRDTHGEPISDADTLWDILDGVARSIMMDHRARVRQVLRTLGGDDA